MTTLAIQDHTAGRLHRVRVRVADLPAWLAEHGPWPDHYQFHWSPAERAVLRRRKRLAPSKWAERHMVIPTGPFEGARMSMAVTPYLAGIMDASVRPHVREIVLCAAPQIGKTSLTLAIFAWFSVFDPGPALSVYPTEATGAENMRERIQPSYRLSPQLRSLLTGRREDLGKRLLRLKTMYHRIAWAGSVTALANRSIKLLNLDEVDKYEERPSRDEAGTIDLARIRTRSYRDHKIFMLSSPSIPSGHIWRAIIDCEAVFVYWVRCPHCTEELLMDFDQDTFRWPHGPDGHSIDRREILTRRLARYVCHHCGAEWDDDQRNQATRMGHWRLLTGDRDQPYSRDQQPGDTLDRHLTAHRPRTIGFLAPSWISQFVSLSEVAHDFLKATDKSLPPEERLMAHQNFQNKHCALPWRRELDARPVDSVLALRDDRPRGLVPGQNQTAALVAGVDTQDNGFYFTIVAIGYGLTGDCWLVREGFVPTFEAVAQVLWQDEYRDPEDNRYPVQYTLQDSLGHRTAEVYDFCRLNPGGHIMPSAGKQSMAKPYSFSKVEFYPGTSTPFPGALQRVIVNTTHYKNALHARMSVLPGDPGGLRLHAEMDEAAAGQLCAEVRNERGHWEQIGSRDNHYWDCLALSLCAAEILGVRYWPRPEDAPARPAVVKASLGL